nr:MAG TPA: hypothetical protein [Caudoviricetes sp.]
MSATRRAREAPPPPAVTGRQPSVTARLLKLHI